MPVEDGRFNTSIRLGTPLKPQSANIEGMVNDMKIVLTHNLSDMPEIATEMLKGLRIAAKE